MSTALTWYRAVTRAIGALAYGPAFHGTRPLKKNFNFLPELSEPRMKTAEAGPTIWFHAASAGELESLWPVISAFSRKPGKSIITVFSPSAAPQLPRVGELYGAAAAVNEALFIGYSPLEGQWHLPMREYRPDAFVTAKYEAWPELWVSLVEQKTDLFVVGARDRRSLRLAARICRLLCGAIPKLHFLATDEEDATELLARFPGAKAKIVGEPRWDRVEERSRQGKPRATELLHTIRSLGARFPRPWGVLGSAWAADLARFRDSGALADFRGTLWIVPHRVAPSELEEVTAELKAMKLDYIHTSKLEASGVPEASPKPVLLVDEMGFLSELYAAADWAYIGGGFGAGIHSTIEPALHGIPIACGPARVEKFSETRELTRSGQLTVVPNAEALKRWLKSVAEPTPRAENERERWRAEARARLGAGRRVLDEILEVAGSS